MRVLGRIEAIYGRISAIRLERNLNHPAVVVI